MLLDDLIGCKSKSFISICNKKKLKHKADRALKFILDEDSVAAIEEISKWPEDRVVKALPLFKLPFSTIWIEHATAHREDKETADEEHRSSTLRVGYLIERDGTGFKASLLWENDRDPRERFMLCGLSRTGNFVDGIDNGPSEEMLRSNVDAMQEVCSYKMKDKEIDAIIHIEKCLTWEPCELCSDELMMGMVENSVRPDMRGKIQELTDSWRDDWNDDMRFMFATLFFINSRKVSVIEEKAIDRKLNVKRRQRNKLPLYDHKVVKLAHHVTRRKYVHDGPKEKRGVRQHLVMGHYKTLKSGVYWWDEHFRGDPTLGFSDRDYEVTIGTPEE